jgi:DsbC/DsbD-like thiol-disulfide interchange protein
MMPDRWMSLLVFGVTLLPGLAEAAPSRTRAELLVEHHTVQPGRPFTVALRLQMDKGWHTYWQNPGDSGYATEVEWTLPPGFSAGPLQWPVPERIGSRESLSYGYHDSVLLLAEIRPPAELAPGTPLTLKAEASWLECHEACLPGQASLELELVAGTKPGKGDKRAGRRIEQARRALPLEASPWKVQAQLLDNGYRLSLEPPAPDCVCGSLVFLPFDGGVIDHGAPQLAGRNGDRILLNLVPSPFLEEVPERLRGVLVSSIGWNGPDSPRALAIDVPLLP